MAAASNNQFAAPIPKENWDEEMAPAPLTDEEVYRLEMATATQLLNASEFEESEWWAKRDRLEAEYERRARLYEARQQQGFLPLQSNPPFQHHPTQQREEEAPFEGFGYGQTNQRIVQLTTEEMRQWERENLPSWRPTPGDEDDQLLSVLCSQPDPLHPEQQHRFNDALKAFCKK